MTKITVYEKPTCTTCRKVAKALTENGVDFEKVNYYVKPFSKAKLQSLLKKMKMEHYAGDGIASQVALRFRSPDK